MKTNSVQLPQYHPPPPPTPIALTDSPTSGACVCFSADREKQQHRNLFYSIIITKEGHMRLSFQGGLKRCFFGGFFCLFVFFLYWLLQSEKNISKAKRLHKVCTGSSQLRAVFLRFSCYLNRFSLACLTWLTDLWQVFTRTACTITLFSAGRVREFRHCIIVADFGLELF